MEGFRSKSCRQVGDEKPAPTSMHDLIRCYSYAGGGEVQPPLPNQFGKELKIKKGKNNKPATGSSFSSSSSSSRNWSFNDPELQRKTRVASYKVYAMEGKMKGSLKKSFRWIKHTCTQVVYGWSYVVSGPALPHASPVGNFIDFNN